jgi:RNA-splicing ligase RtcB
MLLKGKFTNAVIFSETVESSALDQIRNIINQSFMKDVKVRIMPDVHAGAGSVIGYTATLNEYVVPNFIGVDIGCGLTALPLGDFSVDFSKLDIFIRSHIPSGNKVNQEFHSSAITGAWYEISREKRFFTDDFDDFRNHLVDDCKKLSIDSGRVLVAIGSLGGGNHFISVNRNSKGKCFLVVHSGSRNFGKCVAEYHQKTAAGGQKPKGLEYLTGLERAFYLADMEYCQLYAALNRRVILRRIACFLGVPYEEDCLIESVHNYINFEDNIIRKGAISAHKGEICLIPLSMADGILLCEGKGNPEWNESAPHGAGRLMSRGKAKTAISVEDYKKRMEEAGVWTSCVGKETLDEAPQAYKDPFTIMDSIGETVTIQDRWKEIYNFKASE